MSVTPDLELTMAALGRLARPAVHDRLADAPPSPAPAAAGLVAEVEARAILSAAGFPVVPGHEAASADEVVRRATDLVPPYALKVSLADVGHKDRIGGVSLGVSSVEDLRVACGEIAERAVQAGAAPTAAAVGFLVTEMAFGPEVLVGGLRDPIAGPTVTAAVGGWAAEAGATLGTIVGPRDVSTVEVLVRRWGAERLLGARRTAALVDFLAAFSAAFADGALADYDTVEINPLILAPAGPVIVDALMVRAIR